MCPKQPFARRSAVAAEDGRNRPEFAAASRHLPQSTPDNGLAKQSFFATGKRFYRMGVICGRLRRKILDSDNVL